MANGASDVTIPSATSDPAVPDLGGQTVDQFLGPRPGGAAPPPTPATARSQETWPQRYMEAATGGATMVAPIAAYEASVPGYGWGAAAGTLGLGAAGGVVHQAAEDLFPNTPWVAPTADLAFGLGTGGVGLARQLGSSAIRNFPRVTAAVGGAAGAIGILASDRLAETLLNGGAAHLMQLSPEATVATTLAMPLLGAVRIAANPRSWPAWAAPVATTLGGLGQDARQWVEQGVQSAYAPHQYNP